MRVAALLRGVNVSGHKVDMARLRQLLSRMGMEDVQTYLQSGNAVFSTGRQSRKKLAGELEAAIEAEFGFECRVILRTGDQLAGCMAEDPLFAFAANPSRHLVGFLGGEPDAKRAAALMSGDYGADRLHIGREHLYCARGISTGRRRECRGMRGVSNEKVMASIRQDSRTASANLDMGEAEFRLRMG